MELGDATWTEVDAAAPAVLLVPVGSCEQHGPHLPLDTDTRVAVAVARGVAARRADIVLAPPVAFGASGEHQAFPGTLSIGTEVLTDVLVELGRSAAPSAGPVPYRGVVFVNGHGGNRWAVQRAVAVLVGEGRTAHAWAPSVPGGDGHAGRTETSLLLALAPGVVRPDRPAGATAPVEGLLEAMRAGGVRAVSPNGVLGDAADASAGEGAQLLAALVDDLTRLVGSV